MPRCSGGHHWDQRPGALSPSNGNSTKIGHPVSTCVRSPNECTNRHTSLAMGALVCMSRRDIPVCPGDVIICRRSCAEPGSGLFAAYFLPHDVTLRFNQWCQVPPRGGNWPIYMSRSSGQNALRPWPWSYFVDPEILFYFVQRVSISKLICIYLQRELSRQPPSCPGCADRFGSGHWGYADCMRAHPSRCKRTHSAYPDVPTGTFGTCKQVLPMIINLRRSINFDSQNKQCDFISV